MLQTPKPLFVVHADWGKDRRKRWMASAAIEADGTIHADAPEPVRAAKTLLESGPSPRAPRRPALFGFDFPIGLPVEYASRAGISSFPNFLSALARGDWPEFATLAEKPDQISTERPFYPRAPGGTTQRHLFEGHGVPDMDALRRRCERARPGRRAASSLFWTLGGQQVGRAALSGWLETILPALAHPELDVALWPFDGALNDLLAQRAVTVAETYPAEFYSHLGIERLGSKRRQHDRAQAGDVLRAWATASRVSLASDLRTAIDDGFGSRADGEDRFDAVVGLFGMLNVLLGRRESGEPRDDPNLPVEGWILGQDSRRIRSPEPAPIESLPRARISPPFRDSR